MTQKQLNDMLAMMGGDKKTLDKYAKKYLPKENKVKNKEGKFIVKTKIGYFIQDTSKTAPNVTKDMFEAVIFTNYDDAKIKADKYGGKVIKLC